MIEAKGFPEEVQEVIDFALQGKFLFGVSPPGEMDIKVVKKVPDNISHSGTDGKPSDELSAEKWTYQGICEQELVVVYGTLSRHYEFEATARRIERILLSQWYYRALEEIIPDEVDGGTGEVVDYIRSNMLSCGLSRLVLGKAGGFWDKVFDIYKSGGMPVGWSGKYPQGRLMVIYPGIKPAKLWTHK